MLFNDKLQVDIIFSAHVSLKLLLIGRKR
jgi:hypothetical protein